MFSKYFSKMFRKLIVTHFSLMFHFYTPWKRQKTIGIEMEWNFKVYRDEAFPGGIYLLKINNRNTRTTGLG